MKRLFLALLSLSAVTQSHAQTPAPHVFVSSARLLEGNSGQRLAQFRVSLSSPPSQRVGIYYTTANGSALAGRDYIAMRGNVVFAANQTAQTISIPVLGDTEIESDELFLIKVTSSTYQSSSPAAYGTIVNDDKPAPTPVPLGKIVFSSRQSANSDITVMNGNGTNKTNLTNSPGEEDTDPRWSPNGQKIAFSSYSASAGRQITVMNADGTGRFVVPQPQGKYNFAPCWSPNGSKLAFISQVSSYDFEIFATPASPRGLAINVSRNPKRQDFSPQWSPDGKRIVWDSSTTYQSSQVVVAPADASGSTQALTGNTRVYAKPQWSPDGQKIVFQVRQSGGDNRDIYLMNADGTKQSNLTLTPSSDESDPQWSPDGKRLVFELGQNGKAVIMAMDALGKNLQRLSNTQGYVRFPQWDPFSSRVVFVAPVSSAQWQIYAAEAVPTSNGSKPSKLLANTLTMEERVYWARGSVPPPPVLSAQSVSLPEGNSGTRNVTFHLTLSNVPQNEVRVTFVTRDISANAGEDYIARSGSFVIPAKTRTGTFVVPIIGDTTVEGDEAFAVRFSAPGYSSADPTATCTIKNDDVTPTPTPVPTVTPTPEVTPTPVPTPSGKIVFSSSRDGNDEIYVMNADGTNQTNLTQTADESDKEPKWSPDGSKIAWVSAGNIAVMNSDGTNRFLIPQPGVGLSFQPQWSPDGAKIAFVSRETGGEQIYTSPASPTGEAVNISRTPNTQNQTPAWSPDSQRLIWNTFGDAEIWTAAADGSDTPLQLTDNDRDDFASQYSPDGSKILFVSAREGEPQIYVMNSDGTNPINLTQTQSSEFSPRWSPDGSKVAFISQRDGASKVYVMNADGSHQTCVSDTSSDDSWVQWSPDGELLAFMSSVGTDVFQIYTTGVEAIAVTKLTQTTPNNAFPEWTTGSVTPPPANVIKTRLPSSSSASTS